jgi:hypothetical protein
MKRLIAALIVVHRYVGLVFCLIFFVWFASGIVMVYKRMPEFSAEERLRRLPPLDASAIRLTPAEAFEKAGLQGMPQRVLVTSFQSRPVYRFAYAAGSLTVFADDGTYVENVDPDTAVAISSAMFPESSGARLLDSKTEPDQWTINNRFSATGALHRVALGDAAGTEVYVAEATGEIVNKTDRSSRFWGYAGPVMHWFYFTPLRSARAPLWNDLIVYGSVIGCVLCVLGIVIGVYRFSMSRRFMRGTSMTPYVGWLRWHHYAGLLFGVITFTWTFSGLLTMTPWNLFPSAGPTRDQVRAIRGDGLDLARFELSPSDAIAELRSRFQPKELELTQFMGTPFYAAYERPDVSARPHQDAARYAPQDRRPARVFVSAGSGTPGIRQGFTQDELLTAARAAMNGMAPSEVTWLNAYDSYYYDRTGGRHLPALRAKFSDPDETWLYLDSMEGSLVLAEVRGSRTERWLYQGLHSLDFPWLYQTPWAWYPLIIGLSLGGLALSLTSLVIAWRFLRAKLAASTHPARVSVRQSA